MDVEPVLLAEPNISSADSLVSTNDPDDLANEQTWPTEEEMQGADDVSQSLPDSGQPKKIRKRIPKGMSEYQASWILDEEEDEDEDEDGGAEGNEVDMEGEEEEEEEEEMVDMPDVEDEQRMETDRRSIVFQDLDNEEEAKQFVFLGLLILRWADYPRLDNWRNRKREEENDATFPDEIDTPKEMPARTRFQRYRGMRSFRTSPWDPFENLPRDYGRIFQFEDFKRTERGLRRRADLEVGTVDVSPITL